MFQVTAFPAAKYHSKNIPFRLSIMQRFDCHAI